MPSHEPFSRKTLKLARVRRLSPKTVSTSLLSPSFSRACPRDSVYTHLQEDKMVRSVSLATVATAKPFPHRVFATGLAPRRPTSH